MLDFLKQVEGFLDKLGMTVLNRFQLRMLNIIYIVILFLFTIYSYSQIDLNLTLSSNQFYQSIQQQLILLGYYDRSLSTIILVVLLICLYLIYLAILILIKKDKLSVKKISILIGLTIIILLFSYSAFSHDLFNYMFDGRIVTTYGQNPYLHSALDFPGDLWTRFMHWTHRIYPYGLVWLIISIIPSYLGFGKFVFTLLNFKLMFTLFHIGNAYLIYKILTKINPKQSLFGTAFYAFNPVILIESLVSPHNEVSMLFFLFLAIYQIFVKNNKLFAIIFLLLSAGIKFITIILSPLFLILTVIPDLIRNPIGMLNQVQHDTKYKTQVWLILIFLLLIPPLLYEMYIREPYSWYFIPILGVSALLIKYESLNILISGVSLAAFLRYLPFLYYGEYSKTVSNIQNLIFIITIILAVGLTFLSLREEDPSLSLRTRSTSSV